MRLLFSSIYCYLDPASGAALCTRELLELLAARGMDCRVLTTGILDPERETALEEVLAALELPDRRFQAKLRTGGSAEVVDLAVNGVRVTLTPTVSSRTERSPDPREAAIFLELAEQVFDRFRPDVLLSPIELDERAETLITATPAPQVGTAATKRVGSGRARRASDRGLLPMTLQSYLELLDWTGRQLRAGPQGVIPQGLESMLDRLQVSAESWLETVAQFGRRFHRAVGLADHLKAEAQRLGVSWLHGVRSSQVAVRTLALSWTAPDPFLRIVAILPGPGLTGVRSGT